MSKADRATVRPNPLLLSKPFPLHIVFVLSVANSIYERFAFFFFISKCVKRAISFFASDHRRAR
ncbi:hypothetical protein [Thiomonas sp.]|uniref:hypothetical protein n=1 Tax=Thiomonas sp. TaxID=2047785 RepID=UPI002A36F67E|nr:hypothetical protein [Thiomonas sp.]